MKRSSPSGQENIILGGSICDEKNQIICLKVSALSTFIFLCALEGPSVTRRLRIVNSETNGQVVMDILFCMPSPHILILGGVFFCVFSIFLANTSPAGRAHQ